MSIKIDYEFVAVPQEPVIEMLNNGERKKALLFMMDISMLKIMGK